MTWDDLVDYYIGQVGIDPDKFWQNTWRENQLLGESHTIKINLQWEQTRYLATLIHNVNVGKKSQMIKPEKLLPLPQDVFLKKLKAQPKSTPKQFEDFMKQVRKTQSGDKISIVNFAKETLK